jgi:hypothetical protein
LLAASATPLINLKRPRQEIELKTNGKQMFAALEKADFLKSTW